MRAFSCARCNQLVFFEDSVCASCGALVGYDPATARMHSFVADPSGTAAYPHRVRKVAELVYPDGRPSGFCRCEREVLAGCNWLVRAEAAGSPCESCRLTRTLPSRRAKATQVAFAKAEAAKRRLLYQLADLGLPVVGRDQDPDGGLAFELLAAERHVVTGHDKGIITLDLNESDDAFREETRRQLGEAYRTVLGHFRHEIGHYYWRLLVVQSGNLERARELFGDERADYADAMTRNYSLGPSPDWGESHVSAYATVHPLEDWSETFAHYLHIRDTIQTAESFGVLVTGPVDARTGRRDPMLATVPSDQTAELEGFDAVVADWMPLTFALNSLNRSMGKDDLYPFVLPPTVVDKLAFVHELIAGQCPGRHHPELRNSGLLDLDQGEVAAATGGSGSG